LLLPELPVISGRDAKRAFERLGSAYQAATVEQFTQTLRDS
jgi:hypothetical protein